MWNPRLYTRFKHNFHVPFPDLLKLVDKKPNMRVIDLGCGTGELTSKLAASLPNSDVLGIDSSQEMLQDTREFERKNLQFQKMTIEEVVGTSNRWNLVFSHTAIQWVDNHKVFIPKLIDIVAKGGQLAMNMAPLDDIYFKRDLDELANKNHFKKAFQGWRCLCPVLTIEEYANMLYENGGDEITVIKKVYPTLLKDADTLFEVAATTVLIPFMKHLPEDLHQSFIEEYKMMLRKKYPGSPVLYPDQRLFLAATF